MKPSEIKPGCLYEGRDGRRRKVQCLFTRDGTQRLLWIPHGRIIQRTDSLWAFARWAQREVTVQPDASVAPVGARR